MPNTKIRGTQVQDTEVRRNHINIDEAGNAAVTRVQIDNTLQMSQTGVDAGTGDVVLGINEIGSALVWSLSKDGVPSSGTRFLGHAGIIPHTVVPLIIGSTVTLDGALVSVGIADATQTFALQLWSNMLVAPTVFTTLATLLPGTLYTRVSDINLSLPPDTYGLSLTRTVGTVASTFVDIVTSIFIRE